MKRLKVLLQAFHAAALSNINKDVGKRNSIVQISLNKN
eukprot:CAMPEP_0114268394 /NCGR_PEP_ID=MMETSP0058-20121206/25917_1 /TAXON_ID=36894 /ORGANISM="Pyramimonas parkeae, CCMP726" /LENGTH=37 /DNA_ID= /DNA_START= /DNA_END= /DNA_ORIENTATION=